MRLRDNSFANSDVSLPYVRRDRKNDDGEDTYRILWGEGLDQLIDVAALSSDAAANKEREP